MKKIFWIIILSAAFSVQAEEVNRVVAMVNSEIITSKDLDDYCKMVKYQYVSQENDFFAVDKDFRGNALEKLIEDKLILAEAKKDEKIIIDDEWVDERIESAIKAYQSRELFEASLVKHGLNNTIFRKRFESQFLVRTAMQKNITWRVSVSPQEIMQYYNDHKDDFRHLPKYAFWMATFEDDESWDKFYKFFQEKGIIETSVIFSDSLSKIESTLGELREEFATTIEKLEPEGYTPVDLDGIKYFFYLIDVSDTRPMELEDARTQIKAILWDKKFKKRYKEWVGLIKGKAVIKIYD
ncbi:MAG: hypothetical protein GY858_04425 [Candidatus Omnitrophica bacterium]|nr:hypothetical protein [Candidatus Omnitrophota bacterium]